MPEPFKVVVTDYDFGDLAVETEILGAAGARVVGLQAKSEDDMLPEIADCDGVINQYARIGDRAIGAMRQCRVIARYGVGVDIVDVVAASARGILVTNVQDYCTEEVADHAVSLWLALARKLSQYDRATHAGIWRWQSGAPIHRLRDRTMGIVSFGRIGQAIATRARAFGVKVLVFDPYVDEALVTSEGARRVEKDELLRESDYIMMQVPMSPGTKHFLGPREFDLMRPGVIVVNTGRGPTIDNAALYDALVSGKVAAAGLDDPEEEPAKRAAWSPHGNRLFTLPNVLVTPHAAYYSEESIRLAREIAASEVAKVLTGQTPRFALNRANLRAASPGSA